MQETPVVEATATETVDIPQITPAELLNKHTICLVVRKGQFGNRKKATLEGVTVSADKRLLGLSKQLLASPELDAIGKLFGTVTSELRKMSNPSRLTKGGVYRIAHCDVVPAIQMLRMKRDLLSTLADRAAEMYETRITETCDRLGVKGSRLDYPSPKRFRSLFYLEWELVTYQTPENLALISEEIFEDETEKARTQISTAVDEWRYVQRAALLNAVEMLQASVTPEEPGGKKKRHSSAGLKAMNAFLATFDVKNATGDGELGMLAKECREIMAGVDTSVLKSDELVRQTIHAKMTAIGAALKPLAVESRRSIRFDDEIEEVLEEVPVAEVLNEQGQPAAALVALS